MFILATRSGSLAWGVILIAVGMLHLTFRRFYARRAQAIHDARQDTASRFTKGTYRRHSQNFYVANTWIVGALFIAIGIVLVIAHA